MSKTSLLIKVIAYLYRYNVVVYGVSSSGAGEKSTVVVAYSPIAKTTAPAANTTGVIVGSVIGAAIFLLLLILIVC